MASPYTAAELIIRIKAIRAARDSGVLIARHGDESTQFRNLEEMNSIIKQLEDELDGLNKVKRKPRISYVQQNTKGL